MLGFGLKITPCHEFARYAAAKYRSAVMNGKMHADSLAGGQGAFLAAGHELTGAGALMPAPPAVLVHARNGTAISVVAGKVARGRREKPARIRESARRRERPGASREAPAILFCSVLHSAALSRRPTRLPPREERRRILIGGSASSRREGNKWRAPPGVSRLVRD